MSRKPRFIVAKPSAHNAAMSDHARRVLQEPSDRQKAAGNYRKKPVNFQGLRISIECPAGTARRGKDPNGHPWMTVMQNDYGYIRRTEGVDGDHVDVYLGPNPEASMAYVVHQRRAGDWEEYDEDKCMLGFDSQADAEAAFLAHYDDPRFLGPVTAMPMEEFKAKVRATFDRPAMVKGMVLFLKAGYRERLNALKARRDPQAIEYTAGDEHGEVGGAQSVPGYDHGAGDQYRGMSSKQVLEEFAKKSHRNGYPIEGQLIEFRSDRHTDKGPATGKIEGIKTTVDGLYVVVRFADGQATMSWDDLSPTRSGRVWMVKSEQLSLFDTVEVEGHTRKDGTYVKPYRARRKVKGPVPTEAKPAKVLIPAVDALMHVLVDRALKPSPSKKFYVTMIRDGKAAYLAGPFDNHEEAKGHVEPARNEAWDVDPWSEFDSFGTASVVADRHPPGVLNERLGIAVAPSSAETPMVLIPAAPAPKPEATKPARMSYQRAVAENMKHMGTNHDEWSAVGITGMEVTEADGGDRTMPTFEFPTGYSTAPGIFADQSGCCHLCGANIKNVYWLQNDKRKWVMPVGSECVTHFNEGESGEKLAKRAVQEQNLQFLQDAYDTRIRLFNAYKRDRQTGYGRKTTEISYTSDPKSYEVWSKLRQVMGKMSTHLNPQFRHDPTITKWVKKNKDVVADLMRRAQELIDAKAGTAS